jgi:hypothetical protein
MTKKIILILGCHRSGTSVVARAMQCLGASFPSDLMPASPENPAGYWESATVQKLNDYILWRCETAWDQPLEPERLAGRRLGQETDHAVAWLAEQPPLLALKDPRICRLLPFWRPVFAAAEVEVSVVHVLRHPMAVAQSLRKRGIPVERGLALWLEHVVRAREDVDPKWKSIVVEYPGLMTFGGWLYAAAERFDLTVSTKELEDFIEWHQPDLDHHPMGGWMRLPFLVRAVWDHLEQEMERA